MKSKTVAKPIIFKTKGKKLAITDILLFIIFIFFSPLNSFKTEILH